MSQEGTRQGELARPTELERVLIAPLDPFGAIDTTTSFEGQERPPAEPLLVAPAEDVHVRRPPALPGVELWSVRHSLRPFVLYHWAYGFCTAAEGARRQWRYRRQTFDFGPGDTMLIEPNEVQVLLEGAAPTNYHMLLVHADALDSLFGEHKPQGRHFPEGQVNDPALLAPFERIWRAIEAGGSDPLLLESLVMDYLRLVFARAGETPPVLPATGCERAIRRAREYVEEKYAEKISLDDLAREAGLSKFHLERSFTGKVGIALYQFVKKVRISRALQMLRSGRRPAEVAPRCGFSDQPHMTRVFREDLGFTPRHYWAASRPG